MVKPKEKTTRLEDQMDVSIGGGDCDPRQVAKLRHCVNKDVDGD